MYLYIFFFIRCRDDEHCTALMLAAAAGHTVVMKILLDNQASVNDVDKMKVIDWCDLINYCNTSVYIYDDWRTGDMLTDCCHGYCDYIICSIIEFAV